MSQLRESVTIVIPGGTLSGYLFVGAERLPELEIPPPGGYWGTYRPATFPAAWAIWPPHGVIPGPLMEAWWKIEGIQDQLATAQREAEEAGWK